MLLQDPYNAPPVMAAEMIAKEIPGEKGPWASGKWAGVPFCNPWEAHIINLWMMIRLTDRQPVPVYL